jgi:hypothetical protein
MVRLNYAPTQTQAGIVSRTYQYQQQRRQTSRMESSAQDFKHGRNAESVLFSTKSETTDGNFFSSAAKGFAWPLPLQVRFCRL